MAEIEHDGQLKTLERLRLRSEIDRFNENTKLRRRYARCVFLFMVGYTLFMAVTVVLSGLPSGAYLWGVPVHLKINDAPLATLIGGAFASAVGLVAFVVKGLFPQDREKDKS